MTGQARWRSAAHAGRRRQRQDRRVAHAKATAS